MYAYNVFNLVDSPPPFQSTMGDRGVYIRVNFHTQQLSLEDDVPRNTCKLIYCICRHITILL